MSERRVIVNMPQAELMAADNAVIELRKRKPNATPAELTEAGALAALAERERRTDPLVGLIKDRDDLNRILNWAGEAEDGDEGRVLDEGEKALRDRLIAALRAS